MNHNLEVTNCGLKMEIINRSQIIISLRKCRRFLWQKVKVLS